MDKRKTLIKDINSLLNVLKDEELQFILQQAEVLDHNNKIRSKRAGAEEQKIESGDSPDGKLSQSGTTKKTPSPVYIEQTERSKFFNICIGNARLFVDYKEIQALFKIASAASSAREGAPRLYRWFQKERSDVLSEGNIRGPGSSVLLEIYEALLETFTTS